MTHAKIGSDTYIHGHDASVVQQHMRRTAEEAAAFLLPRLESGMRLLDVGCGPGTITTGLARHVAPGTVTGIDVSTKIIDAARQHARQEAVTNVAFAPASVYRLPFSDGSFDVAYAHQVLQHLARPVDALKEMRRSVSRGGLVAVRDADYGTMVAWPQDDSIDRFLRVYHEVAARNGGDADAGRRIPSWLRAAGLNEITITTSTWTFATPESVRNWAESWADRTLHSALAEQAVAYQIASWEELEATAAGWREWARDPDAFFMFIMVEGVGRKTD